MSSRFEAQRIKIDRYPIPATADEIADTIKTLMSSGQTIQTIELSVVDQIIRVAMLAPGNDFGEDEITWDSALRNVPEMIEYSSPGAAAYQVVCDMAQLVSSIGLYPVAWATGSTDQFLDQWLELRERGMPIELSSLIGIPVQRCGSLPSETLMICGSRYRNAEPSDISYVVKTTMELRRRDEEIRGDGQADDRIGAATTQRPKTTADVGILGQRLRRIEWRTPEDLEEHDRIHQLATPDNES